MFVVLVRDGKFYVKDNQWDSDVTKAAILKFNVANEKKKQFVGAEIKTRHEVGLE